MDLEALCEERMEYGFDHRMEKVGRVYSQYVYTIFPLLPYPFSSPLPTTPSLEPLHAPFLL